jgi:tRNA threonylcarbamoyladenosine biosynthesis protein TsaB
MSLILCIETSVKSCSVAVSNNGECIAYVEEHADHFLHAEKLTIFIQQVLAKAKVGFIDLSAVAISGGPGSFTGLRIGVSVAKGLCFGLDIPLIEINSLEVLFYTFIKTQKVLNVEWFFPMIDARRMEVYTSQYNKKSELVKSSYSLVVNTSSFDNVKGQNIVLFGDGADKLMDLELDKSTITIIKNIRPSAQYMSESAQVKWNEKVFVDLAYYEPFYLKEFGETTPNLG